MPPQCKYRRVLWSSSLLRLNIPTQAVFRFCAWVWIFHSKRKKAPKSAFEKAPAHMSACSNESGFVFSFFYYYYYYHFIDYSPSDNWQWKPVQHVCSGAGGRLMTKRSALFWFQLAATCWSTMLRGWIILCLHQTDLQRSHFEWCKQLRQCCVRGSPASCNLRSTACQRRYSQMYVWPKCFPLCVFCLAMNQLNESISRVKLIC